LRASVTLSGLIVGARHLPSENRGCRFAAIEVTCFCRRLTQKQRSVTLHNIKTRCVIATIGFAVHTIISGCSSTNEAIVYAAPISVTPVTRWASPINNEERSRRFLDFIRTVATGNPAYDSIFREPGFERGAAIVDCRNVKQLGIVIIVDRSRLNHNALQANLVLRFRWQHSSIDTTESKYDYFRDQMNTTSSGSTVDAIFVAGLKLTNDHEYNEGIFAVDVLYKGVVVYQDWFELVNCDTPYAPARYEQARASKEPGRQKR